MRAHLNSEPEQNGSNGDHSQKVDPTLFVAGGHLPELLETIDQAFDGIALPTLTLAVVVTYSAPNDGNALLGNRVLQRGMWNE